MAKLYDLIVVGAGPAGIMAAKVAAQNGLSVVLLERKDTIPAITRSCATMFAIEDDYFFGRPRRVEEICDLLLERDLDSLR